MMSSFSGKIKEFPQISVDRFDGRNLASTAYFLSHAHSDHMIGLSSPQFLDHLESNSGVYLYCSQITARFLQASIRHRPLSPYVFPLPHEEPVKITVPNVAEEASHQLWVTLIPAAHCPGSVMFLFEGRGGTVLYTGDFRISAGEVARLRPLHNADGTVKLIDSLLIDTTFCHRDIMHFPTREESSQAMEEAVEDWLARGNNFLIHLVCPAKYGYEYIYRSLHDRFGMKIHVDRWKYRMYDTVPEIQDVLTLDATMTWIHACFYRTKNGEDVSERSSNRQLPCRCVPFGVNTAPNIRVIKPSAVFYTIYQSAKEIKQYSNDGTFCRILLSMHASCSEVLDMVSYLRPRKVFPNVIPSNSTKEEVLKLLHEALNRSGDHYSIEYGGSQRPSLGSFKRQLHCSESSCNGGNNNSCNSSSSSILDAGLLDVYLSSPNKRRRHSDSNMTLVLPTPRGNMKGSLSLEGEARRDPKADDSHPSTSSGSSMKSPKLAPSQSLDDSEEELEWKDPYSPSPLKGHHFFQSSTETCITESVVGAKRNLSTDLSVSSEVEAPNSSRRNSVNGKDEAGGRKDCSLPERNLASEADEEDMNCSKDLTRMGESQDSIELNSVFSEDGDRDSLFDPFDNVRPTSSTGIPGESSIKQSRKMWYKHKYFSTPVHDEVDKGLKMEAKPSMGPRSCSLPLPESCRDLILSHDLFSSTDGERTLPLITVSSPSDQASESQVSDETNVTVVLSSGDPSDSDVLPLDELPQDVATPSENSTFPQGTLSSLRPSVICSPPKPEGVPPSAEGVPPAEGEEREEVEAWVGPCHVEKDPADSSMKEGSGGVIDPRQSGWIDCNKLKQNRKKCGNPVGPKSSLQHNVSKSYRVNISESNSLVVKNNEANLSADYVDIISDSEECNTEWQEIVVSPASLKEGTVSLPSSTRSSCLKTARRTQDHVEVVSLDHPPL